MLADRAHVLKGGSTNLMPYGSSRSPSRVLHMTIQK